MQPRAERPQPKWVLWLVVAGIAVGAVLRLCPQWFEIPPIRWDAAEYYDAAVKLRDTGVYTNESREPGFPFALMLSMELLGRDLVPLLRFWACASIAAMLIGLWILRRLLPGNHVAAAIVTWLWAIDGDQLATLRELYSSPLQQIMLVAAIATLIRGIDRASARWCALAGFCFGVLGLTRGAWAALAFPAALFAMQGQRLHRWRRAGAVVLMTAVIVLPWMVRNQVRHGFFAPACLSGMQLFLRTWHLAPEGEHGVRIRDQARDLRDDFPDHPHLGPSLALQIQWQIYIRLLQQGMPRAAIDAEFLEVARESMRARPGRYAMEGVLLVSRVLGGYDFTWLDEDYQRRVDRSLDQVTAEGHWGVAAGKVLFRLVIPAVATIALVGGFWLAVRRRRRAHVVLIGLALCILAIIGAAANTTALPRYRSELDVPLFTAIAAGLALLAGRRGGGSTPDPTGGEA